MPGGIYVALSGMRHHAEQLDQIASDIANASTSGYKSERSTGVASERPSFSRALQAAIDVAPGEKQIDFRPGSINGTGRDLDFALDGRGFFVIETPEGLQYTRNGHFNTTTNGTLVTADGFAVQGETGTDEYGPLVLPGGQVGVDSDGTVLINGLASGKFRVANFEDYRALSRQEGSRFSAPHGVTPSVATQVELRGRALEDSNVSMAEQLVQVAEVARTFEALQRGLFQVTLPTGETAYTRAGGFHLNGDGLLVTAEGSPVEPQITIPPDAIAVSISKDGIVAAALAGQTAAEQVGTIELALFQNEAGLRALGGNLFVATEASGEPTVGVPGTDGLGSVAQGFLEESNVNVAEEMVNMIRAQRAFEANAQVMRTADEMLQQINSLIQ